jgi:hypothetical protein
MPTWPAVGLQTPPSQSSATETVVFKDQVTEAISVSAHIGYGRSVSIEIEALPVNIIDIHLMPYEARDLGKQLIAAAEAAEKE